MTFTIKTNTSNKKQLVEFLNKCNNYFRPPLSYRSSIEEYACKIKKNAVTIEAWNNGSMVAIIAGYFNNNEKIGFLTLLCVLDNFRGCGLSTKLLNECLRYSKSIGYKKVQLEVEKTNELAIEIYKKTKFQVLGPGKYLDYILMGIEL